jgi:hypothetical protein
MWNAKHRQSAGEAVAAILIGQAAQCRRRRTVETQSDACRKDAAPFAMGSARRPSLCIVENPHSASERASAALKMVAASRRRTLIASPRIFVAKKGAAARDVASASLRLTSSVLVPPSAKRKGSASRGFVVASRVAKQQARATALQKKGVLPIKEARPWFGLSGVS